MLKPCKQPGCPNLVTRGFCERHAARNRDRFRELDTRVPPERRAFYRSRAWTEASRQHRINEPLCRRCKEKGRVTCGELAHHNPPLEELLAAGLNPLDDRYLETFCFNCHQRELHSRRANPNTNTYSSATVGTPGNG